MILTDLFCTELPCWSVAGFDPAIALFKMINLFSWFNEDQ
jgi:hypothetical protein